jgi:GNAT superfamily N-acetyltransferase
MTGAAMAADASQVVDALNLPGGARVTVRPIGPPDAAVVQAYVRGLSPQSRYDRFFGPLTELPVGELDRLTHLDQQSQFGLLAEREVAGARTIIGEARYAVADDGLSCECALSVADGWRRQGWGARLLGIIEFRARALGVRYLVGDVLRSNQSMRRLAQQAGFVIAAWSTEARMVRIIKDLARPKHGLPCEELTRPGARIAA